MKKATFILIISLSLLLVLSIGPASAAKKGKGGGVGGPVDKGSFMLGGDVNFNLATGSSTIEPDEGDDVDTDIFNFGMDALAGYFVINRLEVGGVLAVEYESEDGDDAKETDTTFGLGPQVGYFYQFTDDWSAFGMLPIGYMKNSNKVEPDDKDANETENSVSGWFFEPRAGVAYHLNNSLALTASVYFRYFTASGTQDNGDDDRDYDFKQTQLGLKIGLLAFM